MKGERLVWYKLAAHLGLPKQYLQRHTTSTEFVDWKVFLLEILPNEPDPVLDHLAQIALEVARLYSDEARKKGIKLKRLEYAIKGEDEEESETEISVQERTRRSKAAWGAMLAFSSMSVKKVELPDKVKKRTQEWHEHGV